MFGGVQGLLLGITKWQRVMGDVERVPLSGEKRHDAIADWRILARNARGCANLHSSAGEFRLAPICR
jgi:hypothetical protein